MEFGLFYLAGVLIVFVTYLVIAYQEDGCITKGDIFHALGCASFSWLFLTLYIVALIFGKKNAK